MNIYTPEYEKKQKTHKLQKDTTKEDLIKNIKQDNYNYSKLSKYEKTQIIQTLEKLDLEQDWFSKGSE